VTSTDPYPNGWTHQEDSAVVFDNGVIKIELSRIVQTIVGKPDYDETHVLVFFSDAEEDGSEVGEAAINDDSELAHLKSTFNGFSSTYEDACELFEGWVIAASQAKTVWDGDQTGNIIQFKREQL
jgi:hypothetical protein